MCSLQLWVVRFSNWVSGEGVQICLTVELLCKSKLVYVYWTHVTWQQWGWAAWTHMCWSSTKTENWLADNPFFFTPKIWVGDTGLLVFFTSLRFSEVYSTHIWNWSLHRNNGQERCLKQGQTNSFYNVPCNSKYLSLYGPNGLYHNYSICHCCAKAATDNT